MATFLENVKFQLDHSISVVQKYKSQLQYGTVEEWVNTYSDECIHEERLCSVYQELIKRRTTKTQAHEYLQDSLNESARNGSNTRQWVAAMDRLGV